MPPNTQEPPANSSSNDKEEDADRLYAQILAPLFEVSDMQDKTDKPEAAGALVRLFSRCPADIRGERMDQ